MPSRNSVRHFIVGRYYHVYNRGAHQETIFHDPHDYAVFMSILKKYLTPPTPSDELIGSGENYIGNLVEVNAFCLMHNHFHLLLWLKDKNGITALMKRLPTSYTTYYNVKYSHSGTLYEGKYHMRMIESAQDLSGIINYIHNNPKEITGDYKKYKWSSLPDYLGKRRLKWLTKLGSVPYRDLTPIS